MKIAMTNGHGLIAAGTRWRQLVHARIAPFSGEWSDQQPTMAPDGSYLVFVSNEARLGPDFRTLYCSTDRVTPVAYPRSRAQAEADHARIQSWDNGNQNIWSISLAPWLDAHQRQ